MTAKHVEFGLAISGADAALVEDPRAEVLRLLETAAAKIRAGSDCGTLHDYNGRPAGHFSLTIEEPETTCPECGEEPTRQNPAGEWLCDHCGHAWEGVAA